MNQAPASQQNSLPPPPPYDPNWQLRQTQFYNSPAVSGQYSTGQYSQGQYPPTHRAIPQTGDHQNPRQSKQAQHICELCGNKATTTINVSLQQILCNEHKKHFNTLITHMVLILIKNGPKESIMRIINSLFNKGVSWHH